MDGRDDARTPTMDAKTGFQVLSLNDFDPKVRDYKKRVRCTKRRSPAA